MCRRVITSLSAVSHSLPPVKAINARTSTEIANHSLSLSLVRSFLHLFLALLSSPINLLPLSFQQISAKLLINSLYPTTFYSLMKNLTSLETLLPKKDTNKSRPSYYNININQPGTAKKKSRNFLQ